MWGRQGRGNGGGRAGACSPGAASIFAPCPSTIAAGQAPHRTMHCRCAAHPSRSPAHTNACAPRPPPTHTTTTTSPAPRRPYFTIHDPAFAGLAAGALPDSHPGSDAPALMGVTNLFFLRVGVGGRMGGDRRASAPALALGMRSRCVCARPGAQDWVEDGCLFGLRASGCVLGLPALWTPLAPLPHSPPCPARRRWRTGPTCCRWGARRRAAAGRALRRAAAAGAAGARRQRCCPAPRCLAWARSRRYGSARRAPRWVGGEGVHARWGKE